MSNPAPLSILIVDDDEDDFLIIRSLLADISAHSFALDWAPTFEQGLQYLVEDKHELCLVDYRLGIENGIQLMAEAKKAGFSGPMILLTGVQNDAIDQAASNAGAVDFLVKEDLTAELLGRAIRYAVARRGMENERVERIRAEAKNQAKNEFLARLSHELRSPLTAVLGFTELLQQEISAPQHLEKLRVIERNGDHLLCLINDILDLSKIETGDFKFERVDVDLNLFLSDIHSLICAQAGEKQLNFSIQSTTKIPKFIHTDPTRLRQILLNLLVNAVKFTDEGGIELLVNFKQNDSAPGQLEFTVADTGIGIGMEEQKSVFLPFIRSSSENVSRRTGSGLGLAISSELVQRLGGKISLQSEVGKGSRFTFDIDAGPNKGREFINFCLTTVLETQEQVMVPQLQGSILIVDDLPDIQRLAGSMAEAAGLEVQYASNGSEALTAIDQKQAQDSHYDLILMDVHMPVMGGIEATQILREKSYAHPIVALTAVQLDDFTQSSQLGFNDYLSKPINAKFFYTMLEYQLLTVSEEKLKDCSSEDTPSKKKIEKILIVDDHRDTLRAVTMLVEALGFDVCAADNHETAMKEIRDNQIDLALVDLDLGGASGYSVCEYASEVSPATQFVIVSGSEVDNNAAHCGNITGALMKPVSLESLNQLLVQQIS